MLEGKKINESLEVQERKWLVFPDQETLFLPFFYFVSMAIFSPINVAKVKRHPRRRESGALREKGQLECMAQNCLCLAPPALVGPAMCFP